MFKKDDPRIDVPNEIAGRACATQLYGMWAVQEHAMKGYMEVMQHVDVASYVQAHQEKTAQEDGPGGESDEPEDRPAFLKAGRLAVIDVSGPLTKNEHSMMGFFGGTATTNIKRGILAAGHSKDIDAILLRVDSPGGHADGIGDLADTIRQVRDVKPVVAFVEDIGASAAYWISSAATEIHASKHAHVGSIGVYMNLIDESEAFKKAGLKSIVVKSAKHKGDFLPGTKITDEQLARAQEEVDDVHEAFIEAIVEGRGMDADTIPANGRVYNAKKALKLNLIDAVGDIPSAAQRATQLAAGGADDGGEEGEGAANAGVITTSAGQSSANTDARPYMPGLNIPPGDEGGVSETPGADSGGADATKKAEEPEGEQPEEDPAKGLDDAKAMLADREAKVKDREAALQAREAKLAEGKEDLGKRLDTLDERFAKLEDAEQARTESQTKAEQKKVEDLREEIGARWNVSEEKLEQYTTAEQLTTLKETLEERPANIRIPKHNPEAKEEDPGFDAYAAAGYKEAHA